MYTKDELVSVLRVWGCLTWTLITIRVVVSSQDANFQLQLFNEFDFHLLYICSCALKKCFNMYRNINK